MVWGTISGMELENKTALITGASGKLGGAIALALAQKGCSCVCHYHGNSQKAHDLVEQLKKTGAKAMAVSADLSDEAEIEMLFEQACKLGTPTILINLAAVFERMPLEDITSESMQRIFKLNTIAPVLTAKIFARLIKKEFPNSSAPVGKIINISDIGGIRPWAEYIAYCSSKAALIGATKALAKELAPAICVNSIAPGIAACSELFDQQERAKQLALVPMQRIALPQEITSAIIFLLENDYITGQVLNVDGGRCI